MSQGIVKPRSLVTLLHMPSKNKGVDQLYSYCTADLHLFFFFGFFVYAGFLRVWWHHMTNF